MIWKMHSQISHHFLLCATPNKPSCCKQNEGNKTWEKLKYIIKELNLEDPNRAEGIVLRSKIDCLRICTNGPILLIWPEGIWYNNVSSERIEKIVITHVIKRNRIKEWVFKETPLEISTSSTFY